MICVLAVIIFGVLGIFNLSYRRLAKEAWSCVLRRLTFRPCNAEFSSKLRINIVGAIFRRSKIGAAFVNKYFEILAWLVVIIFSIATYYTAVGFYNYVRYQTCNPLNPEDCPIGVKSCVNYDAGSFWTGLKRMMGSEGDEIIDINSLPQDVMRLGPENASIKIVEFVDFQCPVCAQSHKIVGEQILPVYKDRTQLLFVNFPLPQHRLAKLSAFAAIAALEQGKFWEYASLVFENQSSWSALDSGKAREVFVGYAKDLGLDIGKFEATLDSPATKEKIEKDLKLALKFGVNSTPTHFINGQKHVGVFTLQDLNEMLNLPSGQ